MNNKIRKSILGLVVCTVGFSLSATGYAQGVEHFPVAPYVIGNDDAPNVLWEFGAFSCPYCAKSFLKDFPKFKKLAQKGVLKIQYMPSVIHGEIDVDANQIFYITPIHQRQEIMTLMYSTQTEWASAQDPAKRLAQIVNMQGGIPMDKIQQAYDDDDLGDEIAEMNESYFKIYNIQYTPSYIYNGNLLDGTKGDYYDQVFNLIYHKDKKSSSK